MRIKASLPDKVEKFDFLKKDRSPLGLKFTLKGAEVLAVKEGCLLSSVQVGDKLILVNGRYIGPDITAERLRSLLREVALPMSLRFLEGAGVDRC